MLDWDKQEKLGFFMGVDTITPVKFIHKGVGTGKIEWKYFGLWDALTKGREMSGISSAVLGGKYYLYTGDKKLNKECWMFHMDIQGNPVTTPAQSPLSQVVKLLQTENNALKEQIEYLRKLLFDSSHKDRLTKEAVVLASFRKEVIESGTTGAEQYYGGSFGNRINIPPRIMQ